MTAKQNQIFEEILAVFSKGKNVLSISDISEKSGHHRHTIARYMDSLVLSGKVEMRQHGQKKKYFLSSLQPASSLLNFSTHMLIILNTNLTIRWANETFIRMINSTYQAIKDLPIETLHLDQIFGEELIETIHLVTFSETRIIESSFTYEDKPVTYLFTISSVSFFQQQPAIVITGEDISEKRSLQEAIRINEINLRVITESVRDIIIKYEKDGRIRYVSPACELLTGYVSTELIDSDISTFIHSDDLQKRNSLFEIDVENSYLPHTTFRFHTKTGDWIWFETTTTPRMGEHGSIEEFISVWRDITERLEAERIVKEAHQRLEHILEFLPDPIFVLDNAGKVTTWNRAIEELTGVIKPDILGKGNYEVSNVFYNRREPILIDYILTQNPAILEKYTNFVMDRDIVTADAQIYHPVTGKKLWLWIKSAPIYDLNGTIIGAIEILHDISKRKLMEQEIKRQNVILEAVSTAATAILNSPSFLEGVQYTLRLIGEATNVNNVCLFEYIDTKWALPYMKLRMQWSSESNSHQDQENELVIPSWEENEKSILKELIIERQPVYRLVKDLPLSDQEVFTLTNTRSLLFVPIILEKTIWGVVGFLENTYDRVFSQKEIHALEIASALIGSGMMRMKANEEIAKSERQFRTLAQNIPGIVFRLSLADSATEFFNDNLESVTGYTMHELASGQFSSLIPLVIQQDKERVIQTKKNAITLGKAYDIQFQIIDKKGKIRTLKEMGRPILDDAGRVLSIDGIIQEIS